MTYILKHKTHLIKIGVFVLLVNFEFTTLVYNSQYRYLLESVTKKITPGQTVRQGIN